MRLALGLVAAAALLVPAGSASASCAGVTAWSQACVEFTCEDHHCIKKNVTAVYVTCDNPPKPLRCVSVAIPTT